MNKEQLELELKNARDRIAELEAHLAGNEIPSSTTECQSFNNLFHSMSQGLLYQDKTGAITLANPAAEKLLGVTVDQMKGRKLSAPYWQIICEDGSGFPADQNPAIIAFETGKPVRDVMLGIFHPREERYRWVLVTAVPEFKAGEKEPFRVFTSLTDVARCKQTEMALRESEERFSSAFHSSPVPLILTETESGAVLDANRAYCNLVGYSRQELMRSTTMKMGIWTAEERQKFLHELLAHKRVEELEVSIRTHSGETHTLVISSELIDLNGKQCIISSGLDVTERTRADRKLQESETRARAMLNAIPDLMFRINRQGTFLDYKADIIDLFDQSTEGFIGKRYQDIMPPEFANMVKGKIEKTLESGKIQTFEYQLQIPGKGMQEYEARMTPSSPDEVIAVVRNITQRKQAEHLLTVQRDISQAISQITSSESGWNLSLEIALRISGLDSGCIYLFDAKDTKLQLVTQTGFSKDFALEAQHFPFDEQNTHRIMEGESIQLGTDQLARMVPFDHEKVHSMTIVPIKYQGRVIGCMNMASHTPKEISPDALKTLEATGVEIGNFVAYLKTEENLRETNERFTQLANNVSEIFWMADPAKGKNTYVSPAYQSVTGMTPEEVEKLPGGFVSLLLPEDRHILEAAHEKEDRGIATDVLYRIRRPDGSIRWLEDKSSPVLDANGKLISVVGIARDMTAQVESAHKLRESETRFRQMAETIDEVFWMAPPHLKHMIYVSPAYEMVWGRTRQSLMENPSTFIEAVIPEDRKRVIASVSKQADGVAFSEEYRITRPDGSLRWIWDRGYPVVDEKGKVYMCLGVAQDITERKIAEELVRQRADDLEMINIINQAANQGKDLQQIIGILSSGIRKSFNCVSVLTSLPDRSGEKLILQDINFPFNLAKRIKKLIGKSVSDLNLEISLAGDGPQARAARSGQALIANDSKTIQAAMAEFAEKLKLERFVAPTFNLLGVHALLIIPLVAGKETIGLINLGRNFAFSQTDLQRMQVIAQQLVTAIGRKRVEAALRLSEETYRSLVESSEASIGIIDKEGNYHFLTAFAQEMLGVKGKKSIGRRIEEFLPVEEAKTFLQHVQQVISTGKGLVVEAPLTIKNQSQWYRTSFQPIHEPDAPITRVVFNSLDITDRKESEAVLKKRVAERTAEVQDLYENAPTGYHSLDLQGRFLMLNQTELRWLGYTRDELLGRPATEILTSKSLEIFNSIFPLFKERGWLRDLELEMVRKDGSTFPVLVSATAIYDEKGNYSMSRSTVFDITERKTVEDALRASEETYRALFESANDAIFLLDLDGIILRVNERCTELFGYTAAELIGQNSLKLVVSEEVDEPKHWLERLLACERLPVFERDFICVDGTRVETEINLSLISGNNGEPQLIQCLVRNISERKAADAALREGEEQNRLLFEESPDAIALLGPTGRFIQANRAYEDLAKIPAGELIGKTAEELGLVDRQMAQELSQAIQQSQGKGEEFATVEYALNCADGTVRDVEARIFILKIRGSDHILVSNRDISTRKKAEETLRLANVEMERALRLKDEFLANMSHELRTPLNAILGISESLAEQVVGPLNEKQLKYTLTIAESGNHLLTLINDILDLAKINAGKVEIEMGKVDVSVVAHASLRMVRELASKKNQEIKFELDPHIDLVWADERRLKQMLVNLLSNAVKFTPQGGQIGLKISGEQDSSALRFTVWDTGIGINQQDLPRLFQPFAQLDSGLARGSAGIGLGLVLVSQMARLHGGSVSVESEPGKGSRFTISIPWLTVPSKTGPLASFPGNDATSAKEPEAVRPTILLVEDTETVIMYVQDYLEKHGFRVLIASNGFDGISKAIQNHPDLILMDVMMPEMNGLEATERIRDAGLKDIPIIALTALAMPGDRERCLAAGMDGYMSKPIQLQELLDVIRQYLDIGKGGIN